MSSAAAPTPRHFLNLDDYSPDEVERLLGLAEELRGKRTLTTLAGKSIVLLFFDPSLRTRVSMELAAAELGARTVVLSPGKDSWTLEPREGAVMDGAFTEHVKEAAKVLSRYGDCLGLRAFPKRRSWDEDRAEPVTAAFARWSDVPLVNLESSLYHPCQSLADVYTLRRALGRKPGKVLLTWANHPKALPTAVPNSFALGATQQGWDLTIAHPEGYDLPADVIDRCRRNAERAGSRLEVTHDRDAAFAGARVVYAKSWGRLDMYGRDEEEIAARRERGLARWIVDGPAMARTDGAKFMHCLPVRRNVVVADEVIDSPSSIIYDQAENRLHVQKAVLSYLLS
ncbi:MAG TPA: N-acetylornithine carbamoyltransferase [Planctomycetota bacterium]|nr:N-acetylornithine carbamoyltransferase [Planctomycetota bacterium]